jgi:hypothetical protein
VKPEKIEWQAWCSLEKRIGICLVKPEKIEWQPEAWKKRKMGTAPPPTFLRRRKVISSRLSFFRLLFFESIHFLPSNIPIHPNDPILFSTCPVRFCSALLPPARVPILLSIYPSIYLSICLWRGFGPRARPPSQQQSGAAASSRRCCCCCCCGPSSLSSCRCRCRRMRRPHHHHHLRPALARSTSPSPPPPPSPWSGTANHSSRSRSSTALIRTTCTQAQRERCRLVYRHGTQR